LEDATTWVNLRHLLHNQVDAAKAFRVDYDKYGYEDQAVDGFTQIAKGFERVVDLRIDKLDKSSSELIQLVSRAIATMGRGRCFLFVTLCEAYVHLS
jgi:hypothetical protein